MGAMSAGTARESGEAAEPDILVLRGVRVGGVAHGGHCVARVDGKVVFVRHALPGELVDVAVTQDRSKFARGDAVAVLEPSPDRRTPPCPAAGLCGGCDFLHATPAAARALKGRVVAEQLRPRGAERWFDGTVGAATPDDLGWRVRMRYQAAADGRPGLRAHRSHEVVPLPDGGCRIAAPAIAEPARPGLALLTADGSVWPESTRLDALVRERVARRDYLVRADGFWQAHLAAPALLTETMLEAVQPAPGETAFDLYCGVGVFAGALAAAGCRVWGVEGNSAAAALAARNVPQATFAAGDVARALRRLPERADVIVLDPPRAGAGPAVLTALCARRPRVVVYVSCDPAALSRDLAAVAACGYRVESVAAHDLFPGTHHVECVAVIRPAGVHAH